MIEITVRELAEMAMKSSENGTPILFTRRDVKESQDSECFVISVAIADTHCLLVSHVGNGTASAHNVTTYDDSLSGVVEWLSEFCAGDAILVAKPVKTPRPGRVYVDVDAKIAAAATQEEKDAWEAEREVLDKLSIDFCGGWHVGIYKQACGHWEILQSPIYGPHKLVDGRPYAAKDADHEMREDSANRICTRCQLNR